MKKTDLRKYIAVVLIICCAFLTVSCSKTDLSVEDDMFSFELIEPKLNVTCGETVEYSARLTNKTNSEYTLSHALPLIGIYTYEDGESAADLVNAVLIESDIKANGSIDESTSIKFDEPGVYWLRAFCSFSIDDDDYNYGIEPLKIHVEEK